MKKLKAFTILELIVAMTISSLLIGTCFFAYQIIIAQFSNYKANTQRIQEVALCNYVLTKDIDHANTIVQPEQGVLLLNNNSEKLTYIFERDYILRTNRAGTDTFRLAVEEMETKKIKLINELGIQEMVTNIEIRLSPKQVNENFHFRKEYSPHILINAEEYIGN